MLKKYLTNNPKFIPFIAAIAAFMAYLFFYPFRRAYTAGTYTDYELIGVNFKAWMILAQVIGFAISKGIGVGIIAETKHENKGKLMALVLIITLVFLCLFGVSPHPYHLIFLLLANIPLGMYYGLILGFLEGRNATEILVAALTGSFIIGSGFAKYVGGNILNLGVPLFYMPFFACLLMLPLALGSIYVLHSLPVPSLTENMNRGKRITLNKAERKTFYSKFTLGLISFIVSYIILTCFREFRDNFTPEIWNEVGVSNPNIFLQTEVPIALAVMGIMVLLNFVKNHIRAFFLIISIMFFGALLIFVSTIFYTLGYINMYYWFMLSGLGAYMAYAMSNSLFFERFIGAFNLKAQIGFLITLADYYAYFGSLVIVFTKYFLSLNISYLTYFKYLCYAISLIYMLLCIIMFLFFKNKSKTLVSIPNSL